MRGSGFAFVVLVGSTALLGCNNRQLEPKPETHKVTGTIVLKNGKSYAEGGSIQFQPENGASSMGIINEQGAFELYTVTADHRVEGALEGTHTVTIMPLSADQDGRSILLRKKYKVGPGDNNLTIVIED